MVRLGVMVKAGDNYEAGHGRHLDIDRDGQLTQRESKGYCQAEGDVTDHQ